MEASLHIGVRALDRTTLVVLQGEADLATCVDLREALDDCHGNVVVDLAGVRLLDASCMSVLVGERNRLAARGGGLRLRGPTGLVRTALHLGGLAIWMETPAGAMSSVDRTCGSN